MRLILDKCFIEVLIGIIKAFPFVFGRWHSFMLFADVHCRMGLNAFVCAKFCRLMIIMTNRLECLLWI